MFSDEMSAGETAVSYADDFVDAAIAKLDSAFGEGYARANPAVFAAYLATCASNLNSFMMAATAMAEETLFEAMAELEDMDMDLQAPPAPPRSRKKRGN